MTPENEMLEPINKVFWSDNTGEIFPKDVVGKCRVLRLDDSTDLENRWFENPTTFFFDSFYNHRLGVVLPLDEKTHENLPPVEEWTPEKNTIKPLATLGMFCGCGGLPDGFKKSGIADVKWVIESDPSLVKTYNANSPETKVFCDNCNVVLRKILDGNYSDEYPKKGEVDMIIGSPSCKGLSGLSRFSQKEYSRFQNSSIVSYLSYVDYYRPSRILLENIAKFAEIKEKLVIKLVIWSLVEMGYQCSYNVFNYGNYGVPQSRCRTIVVATRPGKTHSSFPGPITFMRTEPSQTPLRSITPLYIFY